jgi:hypothetical protein
MHLKQRMQVPDGEEKPARGRFKSMEKFRLFLKLQLLVPLALKALASVFSAVSD